MIARVMTVAGSDSGGGAGIQADLKTFTALGVFGTTVLTAVTAQNTRGVTAVETLPVAFVRAQFEAVMSDIGADAAKTGMLPTREIIEAVADLFTATPVRHLVVDPVMRAKGGDPLIQPDAADALKIRLLPLATVVTPNVHEAEALSGLTIDGERAMEEAARHIHGLGPRSVLIKNRGTDVFFDGTDILTFAEPPIDSRNLHGTGCTLSAAIAAYLGKGMSLVDAVAEGKKYVSTAIRRAHPIGTGNGPVNHLWTLDDR